MLKKQHRLQLGTQYSLAHTTHSPLFTLRCGSNTVTESRFGFVISKKISSSAVVRNKIRRTLSAYIEKNIGEIPSGKDYLFITKPAIATISTEELWKEMKSAIAKTA